MFVVGLLLWGAAFAVARVTRNVILLPTIVLLGSFLVPVTAVVWYLDHDPSPARPYSNTGWSALASSARLRSA